MEHSRVIRQQVVGHIMAICTIAQVEHTIKRVERTIAQVAQVAHTVIPVIRPLRVIRSQAIKQLVGQLIIGRQVVGRPFKKLVNVKYLADANLSLNWVVFNSFLVPIDRDIF